MTITVKKFLTKTRTKAAHSAQAFLSQYREWLTTGELAPLAGPVLARMDSQEVAPALALQEITQLVFHHMLASELNKAHQSLQKSSDETSKESKPYTAIIYGGTDKLLSKGFDLPQDSERWTDLRLTEIPGSHGEIIASKVLNNNQEPMITVVSREDAFARVYKGRRMASHKRLGVNMRKLGFEGKAKQDHSHFSRG